MKTVCLTIRGCPAEIHAALAESAIANQRSLNAETVQWLTRQAALRPIVRPSEAALRQRIKALRFKTRLSPKDVRSLVREGCP